MKRFLSLVLSCSLSLGAMAQQPSITTFAGTGVAGYTGDWSPATVARLSNPVSVATDRWGNLFIAEQGSNVIRKVSPAGIISTWAGDGSIGYSGDSAAGIAARLNAPAAVATDTAGNVYVADAGNCAIRMIDPGGIIYTIAGGNCGYSGDGGPARLARLSNPYGLATDLAGNIYIADQGNQVIRMIDPNGIIRTIAGNDTAGYMGDTGPATAAEMNMPFQLAADGLGNVYFADGDNGRVRKISPTGVINTVAGAGITGSFSDGIPATDARLVNPAGIAIDGSGALIISDPGLYQVKKVSPATGGIIKTLAGSGASGYAGDGGPADLCQFNRQFGIACDWYGNIYVADRDNNVVRKIIPPYAKVAGAASAGPGWQIAPNPNRGAFNLSGTSDAAAGATVHISIISMMGCEVYSSAFVPAAGSAKLSVNAGNLKPGVYLLRISTAQGVDCLRFEVAE